MAWLDHFKYPLKLVAREPRIFRHRGLRSAPGTLVCVIERFWQVLDISIKIEGIDPLTLSPHYHSNTELAEKQ